MTSPESADAPQAVGSPKEPTLRDLPFEVWILVLIAFSIAVGYGVLGPALPLYAKTFGVSTFWASTVISVFALMRFVSGPMAGSLVNKIGERTILQTGILIVALSSFLAGLANSFVWVVILRGAGGIGSAMFSVSAFSMLLRVTTPELRGRAAGAYQGGFVLGGLAGPLIGASVIAISLRAPFFLYAGTLVVAWGFAFFGLRSSRVSQEAAVVEQESGVTDEKEGWSSFWRAIRVYPYATALIVSFSLGFVLFGFRNALLPLLVVHNLGLAASAVALGYGVGAIAQAIFLFVAGPATDRVGRRFSLLVGGFFLVISTFLLAFIKNEAGLFLAMALSGIGAAFWSTAPSAVVGDITGGRRSGPMIAGYQMSSDFGQIIGPLIAGLIADSWSNETAFFVAGGVLLVPFVAALFMRETKGQPAPSL